MLNLVTSPGDDFPPPVDISGLKDVITELREFLTDREAALHIAEQNVAQIRATVQRTRKALSALDPDVPTVSVRSPSAARRSSGSAAAQKNAYAKWRPQPQMIERVEQALTRLGEGSVPMVAKEAGIATETARRALLVLAEDNKAERIGKRRANPNAHVTAMFWAPIEPNT